MRSDSLKEAEALLSLGALNIVQPEFEAALEMAREALLALELEDDVQREILLSEREARFGERG